MGMKGRQPPGDEGRPPATREPVATGFYIPSYSLPVPPPASSPAGDPPAAPPPPAPSHTGQPVTTVSHLPGRLRRALQRELCEGETIVAIYQPAAASLRQPLQQAGLVALTLAGLLYAVSHSVPGRFVFWLLAAAAAALLHWQRSRNMAYVVTNQRCFHLSQGSQFLNVQVRDIHDLPHRGNLDPADFDALRARLWELQTRSRDSAAARFEHNQRLLRDLPGPVRMAVNMILLPDEDLLWLDQPTPRSYFMHAPLNFGTGCAGVMAGVGSIAAIVTLGAGLPSGSALAIGSLLLWTTLGWNLWRQIRGTAYGLTDRRGFIIAPGPRVTQYDLREMQRFQRTQNARGMGRLAPVAGGPEAGFHGVRDVKEVDDLIKGRATRVHSSEVVPATPEGRGDEVATI